MAKTSQDYMNDIPNGILLWSIILAVLVLATGFTLRWWLLNGR